MEEIKLDVQIRSEIGTRKVKSVKNQDMIPGIVYGGKEKDTIPVKVDRRIYERIRRQHQGQSSIFHLHVLKGEKKICDYSTIVKEEQFDPVSDRLLHIDFNRISLTDEIEVDVQVEAVGEAIGVKNDGGSLDHTIWSLDIVCVASSIPEKIKVDVSNLHIGEAVYVKDVVLPEGVRTKHDPDAIVMSVLPPMKEEEETPGDLGDSIEPEVIKEKKDKADKAVD